jgi:hypothetical protein
MLMPEKLLCIAQSDGCTLMTEANETIYFTTQCVFPAM